MKTHNPIYSFAGLRLSDNEIWFHEWLYDSLCFIQDEIDDRTGMKRRINMPRSCSLDKTIAGHTSDVVFGATAGTAFDRLGQILAEN